MEPPDIGKMVGARVLVGRDRDLADIQALKVSIPAIFFTDLAAARRT